MKLFFPQLIVLVLFFSISNDLHAQKSSSLINIPESQQEQVVSSNQMGYLEIDIPFFNSDHFYVVIDDDYDHYKKVSLDEKLPVLAGLRKITIIMEEYDDYSFKIKITADETSTQTITLARTKGSYHKYFLSSYSWIETGIDVIIYTDDDSDIWIDGELKGQAMVKADLPLGKHKITSKNKLAGFTTRTINIKSKKLYKLELYNKPDKERTRWLSLVPGASQIYKDETIRGSLYAGLTLFSITMAILYEDSFKENNNSYKASQYRYNHSTDEASALINGKETQKNYNAAKKDAGLRDIFIYTTLGIYIVNIIDAFIISPAGGYRTEQKADFLKDLNITIKKSTIGMVYTLNF